MTSGPVFLSVTPTVPAGPSLTEAVQFYTGHLGFRVVWEGGGMAGVRRGTVEHSLVENADPSWARNASFSVAVDDLEAPYREYGAIPARVGSVEQKGWGRRECHPTVPGGVCLQFYQRPAPAPDAGRVTHPR